MPTKKQILASSAVIIPASLVLGVYLRERQQQQAEQTAPTAPHREPLQTTQDLRKSILDKQAYKNELMSLKQQHFMLNNEFNKLQDKIKSTQQRMNVNV
ncbi:hypothetical protein E3P99_02154 [Wallemia hederae]|uniref:Uncharacterized protein n=1 Tax=Wallemia hederae TaxID=1540922 RepID=A0A4T0FLD6_9BASI|nr:hypothetical protein E3P99_02154 [Wallemia hederae]